MLSERVPGSSFLRTCPGGGGSKICSFQGDVVGKVNEPGAKAEPFRSRPRRSRTVAGRPPAFSSLRSSIYAGFAFP